MRRRGESLYERGVTGHAGYDGCQGLDVYGNLDESTNLVFYERWDSRDHYQKYLNWRTETGVLDQLGSKLVGPPSIRYYERVDV